MLFEKSIVQIHAGTEFVFGIEENYKYGSIQFKAHDCGIMKKPFYFHFNIDVSNSMSDFCDDKRTKMEHIIQTMKNMLTFF